MTYVDVDGDVDGDGDDGDVDVDVDVDVGHILRFCNVVVLRLYALYTTHTDSVYVV